MPILESKMRHDEISLHLELRSTGAADPGCARHAGEDDGGRLDGDAAELLENTDLEIDRQTQVMVDTIDRAIRRALQGAGGAPRIV